MPVISHERLQKTIGFLADFVGMLGELGLGALQHEQKHALLLESEQRYRRLFDNAAEGLTVFRVERGAGGEVEDLVIVDLNPTQAARTSVFREGLLGLRFSECDEDDERLRAYFDVVMGAVAAGQPARCEVYLRRHGAYELLSAYPAADDLWVVSATDVTELREAERALRRQEEGIRQAYVDVLDAVTGGKLILLTDEQLSDELGTPLGQQVVFGAPSQLATARRMILRAAETRFPGRIRHTDLLSTVGEALDNALKHARGGAYQVFVQGRPPAGGDQRRRPGDRLQDAAPGHARAGLLHRGQPGHGVHDHAAALRARAADARVRAAPRSSSSSPPHGSRRCSRSGAPKPRSQTDARVTAAIAASPRRPPRGSRPAACRAGRRASRTRPRRHAFALGRSCVVLRTMTGVGSSPHMRSATIRQETASPSLQSTRTTSGRAVSACAMRRSAVVDDVDHVDAALGEEELQSVTEVGAVGREQDAHAPPFGRRSCGARCWYHPGRGHGAPRAYGLTRP